jgi:phosphate acetyltransferase
MGLLESLLENLKRQPKRIIFPEGGDARIIQAARQIATRRCGIPILLGDRSQIKDHAHRLDIRLDDIRILDHTRGEDHELLFPLLDSLNAFATLSEIEKRDVLFDRHSCAALLLAAGQADALVGGATQTTSSSLRSLFRTIPMQPALRTASSMLILHQEDQRFGIDGMLFLADCAVIPDPDPIQLADIAVSTADIASKLTGQRPRVAFLSFATHARRAAHPSIQKIREAIPIAEAKAAARGLSVDFDGELQLDAALDSQIAAQKGLSGSTVAGQANVLVFPDLNSGNIAAKMLQVVAGARTYGQIIIGLSLPCAEISRGAHVYDIFGTAVITASQALDRSLLYGSDGTDE